MLMSAQSCTIFFFKQKTAYEMLISDWSSDVCSSDLLTLLNQLLGAFVRPNDQAPLASSVNLHVVYGESAVIDRGISKREVDVDLAPLASQIGRASCWERVCQYV